MQPFQQCMTTTSQFQKTFYKEHLADMKPEYIWKGIDREVVSNIPAVPINTMYPSLPDRVD